MARSRNVYNAVGVHFGEEVGVSSEGSAERFNDHLSGHFNIIQDWSYW